MSRNVLAESVQHLYLCDSSPTMLEQAEGTPGLKITKLEMDEEVPTVSYITGLIITNRMILRNKKELISIVV